NIAVTVSDAAQPANGQPTPRSTVANIPITIADCGFVSTAPVVISQVYANAGQGGASLNANYIEIFNRSAAPVSLDGWSVQVTGAGTSAGFEDPANVLPLSGTINPGQYRLIRWTTPASLGAAIPPADFIRPAGGSLLNNLTA
ncbi:MAG: lamin tail domain-containing protein, partial [Planctomyces sp.]